MLINVRQPWFSAWKQFGWDRDTWGVQITMVMLKKLAATGEKLMIHIRSSEKTYEIDPKRAVEFVENNKAKTTATIVKEVGVIPMHLMTIVRRGNEHRTKLNIPHHADPNLMTWEGLSKNDIFKKRVDAWMNTCHNNHCHKKPTL